MTTIFYPISYKYALYDFFDQFLQICTVFIWQLKNDERLNVFIAHINETNVFYQQCFIFVWKLKVILPF